MDAMWGLLFIALTLPVTDADIFQLKENNHEVKQIANCVIEISSFKKYSKSTIVFYEAETKPFLFDIFKEEIVYLVVDKQLPFIITNDLNKVYKVSKNYATNFLVVIYQSCDKEIDVLINKDIKYIIVFEANVTYTKCYTILMRTIRKYKIYDVTFIIKDNVKVKYNIITGAPRIDEKTCDLDENVALQNINACVNGSLEIYNEKFIFPSKGPTNLRMCKLNVGLGTLYPYSTIDIKKELTTFVSVKDEKVYGSDIEFMKLFSKHMNATFELFYLNRKIQLLMNGTLDVCAGGLYNTYGPTVAYSRAYSGQSITWVYTVEREPRSWQKLVEKTGGLYIFLIFQVSYSLIWKLMCQFDGQAVSLSDTILYSLGALIGTASLHDARSLKQKIVNVSYLLLCIHLSSYISTQMYYYLTVEDPPHTIKTIDELAASDRPPYLMMRLKYFVNNEKYRSFVNTSRDCEDFPDCEKIIMKYRASTILVDGALPEFQSSTAVNGEARVLRVNEDILVVYHKMMLRKGNLLINKVNDVIVRLSESGIYDKLYYESIGLTTVVKAKIAVKNMLSNSYSCTVGCKISMLHLAGAFYLWMIGGILSCCIFIVEMLIKRPL